ncbi:hypothetical protein BY996DRAFT_6411219 [Phakopsora pachyrhizi]|nr:hypothetical protein BY996DRAFT_6411219 [Phakopsora pachyrhizi]
MITIPSKDSGQEKLQHHHLISQMDQEDIKRGLLIKMGSLMLVQDKLSNYNTNVFIPLFERVQELTGLTKEQYKMILDSQRDRGAYVPPTFWIKQKAICEMDDGSETGDDKNLALEPLRRNDRPINILEEIGPQKKQVHFQPPKEEALDTLMDQMEAKLSKQIVRKATTTTKGGPIGVNKVGPDLMDREEDLLESGLEMEMDEVTEAMQREQGELMNKLGVDLKGKNNGQINYGLIGDFWRVLRVKQVYQDWH